MPSPGHLEERLNYQNNDWVYVEWPTNNFGDELFELAVREKTTRDTKRAESVDKGGNMDGFSYGIALGTVIAVLVVIYRWIAGLPINPF
jgi:hypothetical protein